MDKEIIIEEYKVLRMEVSVRLKLLHQFIMVASIFWVVFLVSGIWIYGFDLEVFYTFLLLIPIVFTGLVFNYQDNQRTLEVTAKYIEEELRPKLGDGFEWERYFAQQKKRYQFSSAYKIFALLTPFALPLILLTKQSLNSSQMLLAVIDLSLLAVIIINFRYKLYRVK